MESTTSESSSSTTTTMKKFPIEFVIIPADFRHLDELQPRPSAHAHHSTNCAANKRSSCNHPHDQDTRWATNEGRSSFTNSKAPPSLPRRSMTAIVPAPAIPTTIEAVAPGPSFMAVPSTIEVTTIKRANTSQNHHHHHHHHHHPPPGPTPTPSPAPLSRRHAIGFCPSSQSSANKYHCNSNSMNPAA